MTVVTRINLVPWMVLGIMIAACGKEDATEGTADDAAAAPRQASAPAEIAAPTREPASTECGKGGTECPDGLECVTFRGGMQACGPMAIEALVLITDATLGGGCLSPNPADPLPGASIASVQVIGNDGKVSGYGRLVWDQPGFEVATERGTPPNGSAGPEDACTNYYNLGCDGQAVFEILGENGEVRKLREGQSVIAHLRGQETCGEPVADEVAGAVCNDPAAAASGNLESCTSRVRLIEARSDLYGPDRMGGTIQFLSAK